MMGGRVPTRGLRPLVLVEDHLNGEAKRIREQAADHRLRLGAAASISCHVGKSLVAGVGQFVMNATQDPPCHRQAGSLGT